MKKILIVNDGFPPQNWGGANTIAFLHAKELLKRGYSVRVFTATQDRNLVGKREYEGITIQTFYTFYHPRWWAYKSLNNRRVIKEFERELKAFAPEVVHFHNIHHYISYRAITVAKKSGAKVFLTAHDVMSFAYRKLRPGSYRISWLVNLRDARLRFNPFRNIIIRRYLKKIDRLFPVSAALREALIANGIGRNSIVVHNGVDIELFYACPAPANPVVLFVGRFTPDKGRDVLLRAFKKVLEKIPKAQLKVVGFPAGQREPIIEDLIDALELRKNVSLGPPVPYLHMPQEYCKASVVVVPSVVFDSFPTVNLEAMAAARPVIATVWGGSKEIVEENKTGYLLDPADIETLAHNMIDVLSDPTLAQKLGEGGRVRVVADFSLKQQMDAYEKFY